MSILFAKLQYWANAKFATAVLLRLLLTTGVDRDSRPETPRTGDSSVPPPSMPFISRRTLPLHPKDASAAANWVFDKPANHGGSPWLPIWIFGENQNLTCELSFDSIAVADFTNAEHHLHGSLWIYPSCGVGYRPALRVEADELQRHAIDLAEGVTGRQK